MALLMKIVSCPIDVIAGKLMTKEWRQQMFGRVAGGAGSRLIEVYQRQKVVEGTGVPCPKTTMRINLRTNTFHDIAHPNTQANGFDYSEDFDGVQVKGTTRVFLNFKSIASAGGAQTRSLREVYWFVEGQLKMLKDHPAVYFANILDGDEPDSHMDKYSYLLSLPEFADVRQRVYVGDLHGYFEWVKPVFETA
jgi:hypothetical protein